MCRLGVKLCGIVRWGVFIGFDLEKTTTCCCAAIEDAEVRRPGQTRRSRETLGRLGVFGVRERPRAGRD